jgi:hypothetical protein
VVARRKGQLRRHPVREQAGLRGARVVLVARHQASKGLEVDRGQSASCESVDVCAQVWDAGRCWKQVVVGWREARGEAAARHPSSESWLACSTAQQLSRPWRRSAARRTRPLASRCAGPSGSVGLKLASATSLPRSFPTDISSPDRRSFNKHLDYLARRLASNERAQPRPSGARRDC